ncbi:hypothetical protein O9K51_07136 [Purpureocillium lavendulum]|uniref:Uncharacterized protein n=1 Tax=Purpureocillium lavendulum TaxID=1247861 RepID=A0AB34FQ93_9HYPO|nr:hypothetical protein O9K51_07136 [Purpureocillium lavendulum]
MVASAAIPDVCEDGFRVSPIEYVSRQRVDNTDRRLTDNAPANKQRRILVLRKGPANNRRAHQLKTSPLTLPFFIAQQ